MAALISSPADAINLALVRIGYKWLIGNVYDGSEPAQLALAIYGQTRDEMLRDLTPGFAQREISLTLLKSAPVNPQTGGIDYITNPWTPAYPQLSWAFEYAYPADMLVLGSIRNYSPFGTNFDPQPIVWSIANDPVPNVSDGTPSGPPARVILTNIPGAIASYVAQVTDPTSWDVSFTEAFAAELGRRLAPALMGLEAAKAEAADGQVEMRTEKSIQG